MRAEELINKSTPIMCESRARDLRRWSPVQRPSPIQSWTDGMSGGGVVRASLRVVGRQFNGGGDDDDYYYGYG